jgi:hypothetical protein
VRVRGVMFVLRGYRQYTCMAAAAQAKSEESARRPFTNVPRTCNFITAS